MNIVSCFTRCWDIIENTDVFWWIIKTPILASILVSLQAMSTFPSLSFYYINIKHLELSTLSSQTFPKQKVITTERENIFVSYHQSTSDVLSVSFKWRFLNSCLVFLLYVNRTERLVRPRGSQFTLESWQDNHHLIFLTDRSSSTSFFSVFLAVFFLHFHINIYRNISRQMHTERLRKEWPLFRKIPCSSFLFVHA